MHVYSQRGAREVRGARGSVFREIVLVKCVWCGAYYWFRLRKGTGYGFHAFLTCILLVLLLIQCKISLYWGRCGVSWHPCRTNTGVNAVSERAQEPSYEQDWMFAKHSRNASFDGASTLSSSRWFQSMIVLTKNEWAPDYNRGLGIIRHHVPKVAATEVIIKIVVALKIVNGSQKSLQVICSNFWWVMPNYSTKPFIIIFRRVNVYMTCCY